jgi:hypothetical protein
MMLDAAPGRLPIRVVPIALALFGLHAALATPAAVAGQLVAEKIPDSPASLTGVLLDPSHAPLPGVPVALEDLARRVTHRATTDGQGRFTFPNLQAGDYEAEVTVAGFDAFREPVQLAGPVIEREIVLTIAGVVEALTVVAGAASASAEIPGRQRGDAEPCEPRLDPDTQSPVGGQVRAPRMLTRMPPVFPDHLREADLEGEVRLAGRITAGGSLADIMIVDASHPDFASAAEDAARTWTWEEGLLNCTPVDVPATLTVRFLPQRP